MHVDVPLAVGWTAWVTDSALAATMKGKARPFCRGRSSRLGGPWFPRTGKQPTEGTRWAVYSPAGHLPCLDREGWFLASLYVMRNPLYKPSVTRKCGILDEPFIDEIHEKLRAFFWDAQRFRPRGHPS
jgi:hypothetical protein